MNRSLQRLRAGTTALCFAFLAAATAAPAPSMVPGVGEQAPAEFGKKLDGTMLTTADHAGKVVVLTFWATWCPYCLKELPILEAIQKKAGGDHLQVIAVNTEGRDIFRKVERALRSLTLQLAWDPGEQSAKAFGVKGIPHLVIIGRDGKIVRVYRGYGEDSLEGILADINAALQPPPPPAAE